MQVLKITAERTKRVWNYISLVFSPISFAIMAGYKSNWALLQHYSDFFSYQYSIINIYVWVVKLLFCKWWQLSEYRQHPKMLSNVKFDIVINLYQVILYLTPCEWVHYHQIPAWWAQFTKVPYFLGYWPLKIPNLKNTHLEKYRL